MSPEGWKRVQDIYLRALELPADGREAFVHREAEDSAQAAEVLRMLAVNEESLAFIDRPAADLRPLLPSGLAPGDHLANRYRILREVGAGGMGRVYEAVDEQLKTRVALKTIHPEFAAVPKVLERFKVEIQLSRQVTHPNVCRVFDLGVTTHGGAELHFLTMEFMEGETLASRVRRDGPLTLSEAKPWIQQVGDALAAAHQAGVVHRDLKSSNIFLAEDRAGEVRAVVADFGVAGSMGAGGGRHTTTGWGVGTPAYMAPEQVMGDAVGPAADIYAFGVVMYEMATGVLPYEGETPLKVAVRRVREKPAPPRLVRPGVDASWESVILRCMETAPVDRFAKAGEVAAALERSPLLPRLSQRTWRRGAIAAAAALTLAATGWWAREWRLPAPPSTEAMSWYQRGLPALYNGDWQAAETAFAQAVKASPSFGEAHVRLAEAQIEMERLDDARASLLAGVASGGLERGDKLHSDAVLAFLNRQADRGLELLEQRARQAGQADRTGALLDLGRLLARESRGEKAALVYQEVVERDPGNALAWIQLGRSLGTTRGNEAKSQEAFAKAEEVLRQFPNEGSRQDLAYYRAAVAEGRTAPNRLELAEAADRATLGTKGFRAIRAGHLHGSVLGRTGQYELSLQRLRESLQQAEAEKFDFLACSILSDLAVQLSAQSRVDEQIQMLQEAREKARKVGAQRTLVRLTIDLSAARDTRGRPEDRQEAAQLRTEAAKLVERLGDVRLNLRLLEYQGRAETRSGNYAEAYEIFKRQLDVATQAKDRTYIMRSSQLRGRAAENLRRYRDALADAQRARQTSQELKDPFYAFMTGRQVAELHRKMGHYAMAHEALDQLEPLVKTARDRFDLDLARIALLSEQGRSDEAMKRIDREEPNAVREKSLASVRQYALFRCMVPAEGRQGALAQRACGAAVARESELGFNFEQRLAIRVSLARAAYWGGDAAKARELSIWPGQPSEEDAWHFLLIRAAAEHKLGHATEVRDLRGQIEASISRFARDNGADAVAAYLQRPIYRDLLTEFEFPIPSKLN